MKKFFQILIAIAISEGAGIIGSIFTAPSIPDWYAGLTKPALNPPAWIFAPVWILLYAIMGMASFLIWSAYSQTDNSLVKNNSRKALFTFLFQLALNSLWSIIFFGLRNPAIAFAEIVILWLSIAATIISFYKISKKAACLLLPYIIWVSFAGYLNFAIWMLN